MDLRVVGGAMEEVEAATGATEGAMEGATEGAMETVEGAMGATEAVEEGMGTDLTEEEEAVGPVAGAGSGGIPTIGCTPTSQR